MDDASVIEQLWQEYKQTGRRDLRDRLILHYSPLVKFVAGRVAVGLPQNVEQSDLVSYGIFGLMDAIEKFDLTRGYKFETYAMSRIKGAIIDELRTIDWVPRSVRAKARAIERAYAKLEGELHRTPEEHEVVTELSMTREQFSQTLSQISLVSSSPGPRRAMAASRRWPTPSPTAPTTRSRPSRSRRSSRSWPRPSRACPSGSGSSSPSTTTRA